MSDYQQFLESKRIVSHSAGLNVPVEHLHHSLFPFQRDLVYWSLRKGRAALFADAGLGKTRMQLEWARHIPGQVLILAPLAVTHQTVAEGAAMGIEVTYAREQAEVTGQITVTNYERLGKFDPAQFVGVVLDESSILKAFEGKTRTALINGFADTPYRLCCTATPAPNDIAEFANHAEFLGVMTRVEMLATFFIHDDNGWRLRGHAHDAFYRWMASWGMFIQKPSDLGYDNTGYELPGLTITPVIVDTDWKPADQLFAVGLKGIGERSAVRQATISDRVSRAAELVAEAPDEQWLIWCGLNDEGRALKAAIPDAVLIEGSDSIDDKAAALLGFARGEIRILITKPSIAGYGMNFQSAARMIFVGLGDSYEDYYQSIRRCYRFGQPREVQVWVVLTSPEQAIFENVLRKESEAQRTAREMLQHLEVFEQEEIQGTEHQSDAYRTLEAHGQHWRLLLGDSCERLQDLTSDSIDFSVFSPPFATLYTYSNSERDLGNSRSYDEFFEQFSYISAQLLRVLKPGRNIAVHVQQLALLKERDGVIGLRDFRGDMIAHFLAAGFIYHGEIVVDKDPQAQAIRTKAKSLMFTQLHKDASWMRPALADFLLIFRKPGNNAVPVIPDLTNDEWIEWARPIWYNIRESDTLNVAAARDPEDERHICPLQLETIERCIRLWTNRGETVLSPFAGIGSEVYQAVLLGRRALGIELKESYWRQAIRNCEDAERRSSTQTLFDFAGIDLNEKAGR